LKRPSVPQGFLLDTCTILLALSTPEVLSKEIRRAIFTGPNRLSVVSYWEVMLKSMKGTLDVGDPHSWWPDALEQLAATPLALYPEHVAGVYTLPPIHKDPFDRVLIAQAMAENLVLATADSEIVKYPSKYLNIVS
jgi:PIN domain nuclease of toxin-antitoxin system